MAHIGNMERTDTEMTTSETENGESMTTRIECDWCDEDATYSAPGGAACDKHRRDLERQTEASIWGSGNPFAGEAAECAVRSIAEWGDRRQQAEQE